MRTLKKALSLVLVLAMVFTLAVPALAVDKKGSDFTDYAKVQNKEAVDVLTALGVLNGNPDGTFGADGTFTRAQGATMITYLTLGKTVADALPTSATKFSDVPASFWGAKYIQYCADQGIINGYGDGKFGPDDKLTATQWALMLLGALGYESKNEGIAGSGWELSTTRLAMKAGIASASDMTGTFNRDVAAKMAFNTLKADVVEYTTNGTNITVGDTTIQTGASKAEKVEIKDEGAKNYAGNTGAGVGYQQFCELHFDKLKLSTGSDDFGRTANSWKNGATAVGNYTTAAAVTFNGKTSANDVASALSGYYIKDNASDPVNHKINNTDKTVFTADIEDDVVDRAKVDSITETTFNGVATQTLAKTIADLTANGRLIEFYADTNNVVTQVVVIDYTVGEVTKVNTAKNGDVTYTISGAGAKTDFDDADKADTIEVYGSIAKGDIVTYVEGVSKLHVYPTTTVSGAQSKYNTSSSTITVNGTSYTVGIGVFKDNTNKVAMGDFGNSTKTDNTYYLDQYGFVVKTTAKAASTDYAYIVDAVGKTANTLDGNVPTIEVRAVLADGSVGAYTVAVEKKNGDYYLTGTDIKFDERNDAKAVAETLKTQAVVGYTLDGTTMTVEPLDTTLADGSTTLLKDINDGDSSKIVKGNTAVTADGKTVLLNKDVTIVIYDNDNKSAKVLTGVSDLGSTELKTFATVVSGSSSTIGTAKIVFATVSGGVVLDSTSYAFINAAKYDTTLVDGKDQYIYTGYLADGSTIELTSKTQLKPATVSGSTVGLYEYTAENTITKTTALCDQTDANRVDGKYGYGRLSVTGEMLYFNGSNTYYNMADAQVVYVDTELNDVDGNVGIFVLKVVNGTVTSTVETIYIFR